YMASDKISYAMKESKEFRRSKDLQEGEKKRWEQAIKYTCDRCMEAVSDGKSWGDLSIGFLPAKRNYIYDKIFVEFADEILNYGPYGAGIGDLIARMQIHGTMNNLDKTFAPLIK